MTQEDSVARAAPVTMPPRLARWTYLLDVLAAFMAGRLGGMLGVAVVLVIALVISTSWPRWKLMVSCSLLVVLGLASVFSTTPTAAESIVAPTSSAAPASAKAEPFQLAYVEASQCITAGGNQANCMVLASPRRCATQAIGMATNFDRWRDEWAVCVNSCAAASAWSKFAGDCRKS